MDDNLWWALAAEVASWGFEVGVWPGAVPPGRPVRQLLGAGRPGGSRFILEEMVGRLAVKVTMLAPAVALGRSVTLDLADPGCFAALSRFMAR